MAAWLGGGEEVSGPHPVTQGASRSASKPLLILQRGVALNPGEPTREQAQEGRYKKPVVEFQGLRIRIENPAGSVRRGVDGAGKAWEQRMAYAYGEIAGSMGVDGDPVDVFVGPNDDAPMAYVVHQRKFGDWTQYDEDKVMLGFGSRDDAVAAFLACHTDPRFLGPVTPIPMEEFKRKVRATKEKPKMIKSVVVLFKSFVSGHSRRLKSGKVVQVAPYSDKRTRHADAGEGQLALFAAPTPERATAAKRVTKVAPHRPSVSQFDSMIKIAADSIGKLRTSDVGRVLSEAPAHYRAALAIHIQHERPDLAQEVDEVMAELRGESGTTTTKEPAPAAPNADPDRAERARVRANAAKRAAEEAEARGERHRAMIERGRERHERESAERYGGGGEDERYQALLESEIPGAAWTRGKGRISGHYAVVLPDHNGPVGNYHKDPKDAIREAKEWIAARQRANQRDEARSASLQLLRDRLLAGGEVGDADLRMLDLRAAGSDLKWFIPAAAELFGITSRAVRPLLLGEIRVGHTDMGAERERVSPKRALEQMAYRIKNGSNAAPDAADKANPRKKYYVTMIRGDRVARLAGPFDTHEEALAHVDQARKVANEVDPRSHWDAFGTSGIESDNHAPGVLNKDLGIGEHAPKAQEESGHPAPTPRVMLSMIPEAKRDEWLARYREQHELHHYELGQVREKMSRLRGKMHRAETGMREAEAFVDSMRSAPVPDPQREAEGQKAADMHRAEFEKVRREYDRLVGSHQLLHERIAKLGREQERIYGASGDMDMDWPAMRKRTPEEQRKHEADMLKMYRQYYKERAMTKAILIFTKSDRLSQRTREQIGRVGSVHREDMPADVFLEPGERKYPVKVKRDGKWVYSEKLLVAAAREARMHGREDIAGRADKIRERG